MTVESACRPGGDNRDRLLYGRLRCPRSVPFLFEPGGVPHPSRRRFRLCWVDEDARKLSAVGDGRQADLALEKVAKEGRILVADLIGHIVDTAGIVLDDPLGLLNPNRVHLVHRQVASCGAKPPRKRAPGEPGALRHGLHGPMRHVGEGQLAVFMTGQQVDLGRLQGMLRAAMAADQPQRQLPATP